MRRAFLTKKYNVLRGATATVRESEGFRGAVYLDSLGNETIGIGFLVSSMLEYDWIHLGAPTDASGDHLAEGFDYKTFTITREGADSLLKINLDVLYTDMLEAHPWLERESTNTLEVLLDMSYNMGLGWFGNFKKTVALLQEGEYIKASREMLDSRWARQVKGRAIRLSEKLARSELI